MLKISIPAPCHEDWNKMTPDETGRHCSSCAKSVVDFTGMSDEEVKYFFLTKKDERVCGRFKETQLHRIVIELPQNIYSIEMPLWKKFLAACLIVFSTALFSCETKIRDKMLTNTEAGNLTGVLVMQPDSIETIKVCSETVGITFVPPLAIDTPKLLKGDIEIIEIDSAKSNPIGTIPVLQQTKELIIVGDSIYEEPPIKKSKPDSAKNPIKTKNPPKADSMNCNTIKNYY